MKIKIIIVSLMLLMVTVLCFSCQSSRCNGMQYHNSDVKRGLAH